MLGVKETIQQLQAAGQYMMQYGLAWGNAGNISARTDDDRFVITASGTFLGELSEHDFAEVDFSGAIYGDRKPSKEIPMHQAVYEKRPDIHAVLHASPFYTTMAACSKLSVPNDLFVETMYYLERVERIPYYHPGSEALGAAIFEKAEKANIFILENHGVLVCDRSVQEARMALQTLEMACRMAVTAQSSAVSLNRLDADTVQSFLHDSGYRPRREWRV
ncbi:class II aldolase/adducin family protein [Paenibacillus faecalis]|uniref:class II aldolase/adducin family protein n=1 Tax=Paenibacillus faecalis TaxID=2079532 RepID=UPI000D0FCA82|nr:class II aldolase/adducin family protein [Paenibacillus faecalis]